jgi:hypothetical protein
MILGIDHCDTKIYAMVRTVYVPKDTDIKKSFMSVNSMNKIIETLASTKRTLTAPVHDIHSMVKNSYALVSKNSKNKLGVYVPILSKGDKAIKIEYKGPSGTYERTMSDNVSLVGVAKEDAVFYNMNLMVMSNIMHTLNDIAANQTVTIDLRDDAGSGKTYVKIYANGICSKKEKGKLDEGATISYFSRVSK